MLSGRLILLISFAVGIAASSIAWKSGTAYKYHLSGRTLTTVLQSQDSYAGISLEGQVELRLTSRDVLSAKILHLRYASLHLKLPGGWNVPIPENSLDYKTWPISRQPFEIKLNNGQIAGLVVSGDIPTWEVNILKAVASLLQVDTAGNNLVQDSYNSKPNHTASAPNAVYRTMEDSITGKCEVLYDISPLAPYIVEAQPQLAPLVANLAETPIIDIVKTQNYSSCDRRVVYNFGFPGASEFEHPDDNQVGEFLARSSVSRIVIAGSLRRYTIQSSVTTNKVIISPILYNKQKFMVVGLLNLTLASVRSASGGWQHISNRKEESSLAYSYENAFGYDSDASGSPSRSDASADSGSWEPSSEESLPPQQVSASTSTSGGASSDASTGASSGDVSSNPSSVPWPGSRSASESQEPKSDSLQWPSSEERLGGDRLKRAANTALSEESSSNEWLTPSRTPDESRRRPSSRSRSSSSSEEHEYYLPLPSLLNAPSRPMMPLFAGVSGKSIAHKVNVAEAVRKIAADVARESLDQSAMVKLYSLSKFAILTDLVRTMNVKQLKVAFSSLYYSRPSQASGESESQRLQQNSWVVFRDAVALAGTTPALVAIKEWILSSKIRGEEAAQLIAVLPSSAIFPTPEYLKEFFKLASSPEVKQQQFLNATAILDFANLLRLSQIDNATAHKYYPVHVYGRIASRGDPAIHAEYLPYLQKSLKEAFSRNDSVKIQVYIRAIGNVAHPKILEIFEPYLERSRYATTFQRTLMVVAMNQLAKLYPEVARNVLFKIYQNTAEAHELRCTAVFLLYSTNPPAAMLQRMAEFTNYELHMQVNAAVISGIRSLANLKSPTYRELARDARSALNLLNTTAFPQQFTATNIRDYVSEHLALGYSQTLNYIGSDDSIIPKAWFYNVTRIVGGFKHSYFSLGGMVSSVDNFVAAWKTLIGHKDSGSYERQSSNKWTAWKLRDILKVKPSPLDPLEGNVMVKFAGLTRYLAFDENVIAQLPVVAQQVLGNLGSERRFAYTKFYNQFPVTLAFPMATGLPFVYSLKSPTVISLAGKAHLRTQPDMFSSSRNGFSIPKIVNASAELEVWFASKIEAEAGFVTTFDSKHYIAGIEKNSQVNLPVKVKVNADIPKWTYELQAEPIYNDKETNVLHYSAEPYIVRHDITDLKPRKEGDDYESLENKRYQQFNKILGKHSTGMAFGAMYESSQKWNSETKIIKDLKKDLWTGVYFPCLEDKLKSENASLIYIPDESTTSSLVFTLSHASTNKKSLSPEEWQSEEQSVEEVVHARRKKSTRRSRQQENAERQVPLRIDHESSQQQRMAELWEQVDSDVKSKSLIAVDISAQFRGERQSDFIATAALSKSLLDQNNHFLASVYWNSVSESERPVHMFLNVSSKEPRVPLINFKQALEFEPIASWNASLYFGQANAESSVIIAQAKFNQSKERQWYVSHHPMAQLCEKQMSEGNNVLPACRNVTAEANYMDQLEVLVHYSNVPLAVKNATYKSYSWLRSIVSPYVQENIFAENLPQNQISLYWKLSENLNEWNVSLESPVGSAALIDLPLWPVARPILAVHPVWSVAERLSRVVLGDQLNAKCSIGASAVNTFDNSTYSINLGKCWHALMLLTPKQSLKPGYSSYKYWPRVDEDNDVAVLVRDADSQRKEVKIIVGQNVIDLSPSLLSHSEEDISGIVNAKVRVNDHTLKVSSDNLTEIYTVGGDVWVQLFFVDPTTIKLMFPIHGIKMLYDGQALQLSANDSFRDNVKGLCGTFNGEPISDFMAPNGNYLNDTQLFAAIYSLPEECQGPASTLRRKAWKKAVFSMQEGSGISNFISQRDVSWEIWHRSSSSSSSSESQEYPRAQGRPKGSGLNILRTTMFDQSSEICFSLFPLPMCSVGAHPSSRVEKSIPVSCLQRNNPTAKKLKAMVDRGLNPDLRHRGATKYMKVSLPKSCVKN